jgi:integrase/recombinase XerD
MSRGRRARTIEAYRMALERLCEFLADKPLVQAQPLELEAFTGIWLHKRGVIARSRKPYVSALRGFFAWARSRGLVKENVGAELRHPKTGRPLPHALSLASAEKLMWAPDLNTFRGLRDAAMLAMLMGCGLRASGLVSLNEGDLRNESIDGQVRLVLRVTEKGDRERQLPLPREAEMLLRVYLEHDDLRALDREIVTKRGPDRVLFVNLRHTGIRADQWRGELLRLDRRSVWKAVQIYGDKAGVPKAERHPHAFRHLFGVELAEDEVDLITRQSMMGHAEPKSTAIYSEMTMRRKAKVMDANAPLAKIKTPVSEVLRRL